MKMQEEDEHIFISNRLRKKTRSQHKVYEDERQNKLVTPWTRAVASGCDLLRNPQYNKGLAFTEHERHVHYLRGLLPPSFQTQELQEKRELHNIRSYENPLQKYVAMMELSERNERLFFKLLIDHVEELLPIVYTPTVGEACQKYGLVFRRPHGLYISLNERGRVLDALRNWPEKNVQVIVVTDGERILGLGDLGVQGMGIPVGKLALYTALGGIPPSQCLPVVIDVGTNNKTLLEDPFYIGLRRKRATGEEYDSLIDEFMAAVKREHGEKILVQFEDFANHNAFKLLSKYRKSHLVFNDDIQGTAAVALAGLLASLRLTGLSLAEHKFLFLGAGEAGTGIAEIIAVEISRKAKISLEEARKKIYLVDSKGLVVKSRWESLQHFKKSFAHEHEFLDDLLSSVKILKPSVLIGTSGQGGTFTKDVLEAMASFNKKPVIMALSNPTSQSECTAMQAYTWTKGSCIFCSGSPFDPVVVDGTTYYTGQSNNAYIFPGIGLGCTMAGVVRVHEDMFIKAAETLASLVTKKHLDKGLVFPPFSGIRNISAQIAAAVAATAYESGTATMFPRPGNLLAYARRCQYNPIYQQYR